jgi:hypothetical protein
MPPFDSDGFVWVRLRLPVRSDAVGPLDIRIGEPRVFSAYEVFVNGVLVGRLGNLSPRVASTVRPMVFDLPQGLTSPGAIAVVALRAWYPPEGRSGAAFDVTTFEIDQSRMLQVREEADLARARLANLPALALNLFSLLLGIAVLALWRRSGNKDLLLCGGVLILGPALVLLFEEVAAIGPVPLSRRGSIAISVPLDFAGMWMALVFTWGINGLKDVWFKRLALASIVVENLSALVSGFASEPSPIVAWWGAAFFPSLRFYMVVMIAANLWVIFVKRQNRLIAATMMLVPIASLITSLFIRWVTTFAGVNLFSIASLVTTAGLTLALGQRAWTEWRAHETLQTEFEAAREVQQRLVTPAVDVPGFHVESAYLPATQVGGDFFYIRPENPGSLLVVVGDVSGKGLRAALTVSAIMGALRTMPSLPPTRILGDLNRGLVGQMRGGFVTCCAARIEPDGTATLANAGHLAPYRNGEEVSVPTGLPLGVDAGTRYGESQLSLMHAEPLTFVSDGVVEARKPTGELFGFERARHISGSSANAIAAAAQEFGQEDDITVVQLRRVMPESATV